MPGDPAAATRVVATSAASAEGAVTSGSGASVNPVRASTRLPAAVGEYENLRPGGIVVLDAHGPPSGGLLDQAAETVVLPLQGVDANGGADKPSQHVIGNIVRRDGLLPRRGHAHHPDRPALL